MRQKLIKSGDTSEKNQLMERHPQRWMTARCAPCFTGKNQYLRLSLLRTINFLFLILLVKSEHALTSLSVVGHAFILEGGRQGATILLCSWHFVAVVAIPITTVH